MNWLVLLIVSVVFIAYQFLPLYLNRGKNLEIVTLEGGEYGEVLVSPTIKPTQTPKPKTLVYPFTSQAPFGEWSDKRFQDGCEEASVIMVYCVVNPENCLTANGLIDKTWVKEKILEMYEYQLENWGSGVDTSSNDTAKRLLEGYFGYTSYEVKEFLDVAEIIGELRFSSAMIVPTDGRLLFNPNFTNGGPERHMLVIIGYDEGTDEFITNDPGTRLGRGYRYKKDILFAAIGDYVTGDHEPVSERKKSVIVVR